MRVSLVCILLVLSSTGLAFSQDSNFSSGPQYLMTAGSPYFARPISTPTLSLGGPALEIGAENATEGLTAGSENRIVPNSQPDAPRLANLFPIYYGPLPPAMIEISFPKNSSETPSIELPASIVEAGVSQLTSAQALRGRGYGVTLAQAAANSKANVRPASHVYTNADLDRLHGRS